jgi:CRP/FNR family nitrogen fixation transcriptional regulator
MDRVTSAAVRTVLEGVPQAGELDALERLATVAQYAAGEWVYSSSDRIEYWFRIVRGAARKSALSGDGRRHIVAFLLPGDFFGFSSALGCHFGVDAIVPRTLVALYPRRGAEKLADSDPQLARALRALAFESIEGLQRRIAALGRSSALERVSGFLLEMADRGDRASGHEVPLPMSRYDVADYLGLAVETVSRTLTELRARRVIAFRSVRQLVIRDRAVLEDLAEGLPGVATPLSRGIGWLHSRRARLNQGTHRLGTIAAKP